jgi:hypothetical protein
LITFQVYQHISWFCVTSLIKVISEILLECNCSAYLLLENKDFRFLTMNSQGKKSEVFFLKKVLDSIEVKYYTLCEGHICRWCGIEVRQQRLQSSKTNKFLTFTKPEGRNALEKIYPFDC